MSGIIEAAPGSPAARRMGLHFQTNRLHEGLKEHLPHYAGRYLAPAMAGDAEAAETLAAVAAPNEFRGFCTVLLYLAGTVEALRAALEPVWSHDHRQLVAAARNTHRLRAMFRRAGYALPDTIPDTVRVYRGTSALSSKAAARGHAWTVDRDVACWFAVRFAEQNGRPLVLSAEVLRSMISLYTDERQEREVVIFGGVPGAAQDGDVADWTARWAAEQAARKAEMLARLERYRGGDAGQHQPTLDSPRTRTGAPS